MIENSGNYMYRSDPSLHPHSVLNYLCVPFGSHNKQRLFHEH